MKYSAQNWLVAIFVLQAFSVSAQQDEEYYNETVKPRVRIMIDNDFGGDPDGLFQLVHHILSPSVEIRGIIGSQNYPGGFFGSPATAAFACTQVNELLSAMQPTLKIPVYEGSATGLVTSKAPWRSEGAKAIVQEAMRQDTQTPLYVVCGAGLTTVASAYLMEPRIASKIILIWIGGAEYQGLALPPPNGNHLEYNLGIDLKASQVIFNVSDIPIWQVPRDAYRQALYSYAELVYKIKPYGMAGKFLIDKLEEIMKKSQRSLGETYVLGDSPLVLLTALQTPWEADAASSKYVNLRAPKINDSGLYEENKEGRIIRVYTYLDTRLMFDDLVAKLALLNMRE